MADIPRVYIDVDAEIEWIRHIERVAVPDTPTSGHINAGFNGTDFTWVDDTGAIKRASNTWSVSDYPFSTGVGNAHAQSLSASANARTQIRIPPNANVIETVSLIFYVTGAGVNPTFNISTHYGAAGEAYNNHTGSGAGVTFVADAVNVLTFLDITPYTASLAAGDFLSVLFTRVTDGGYTWYILGMVATGY